MSRVFAYCRVSAADHNTDNQIRDVKTAGFRITKQRTIIENISGSIAASDRKGFTKLLDRLKAQDVLVMTKLDRLGRNAMDVRATVEKLNGMGIRVYCLALGIVDLTSPAGKISRQVIAAVAEFERDLLMERTQAGLKRAKSEGKAFGRPVAPKPEQQAFAAENTEASFPIAQIVKHPQVSRKTS